MEYDMLRTMLMVSFMSFAFERGSECILLALFGLCLLVLYLSLPFSSYFLWISYSHSIRPVRYGSSSSFFGPLVLTCMIIMPWNSNRAGVVGYYFTKIAPVSVYY